MRSRRKLLALLAGVSIGLSGPTADGGGLVGPDVITGDLQASRWWATDEVETAYSIGVTACNLGDEALGWHGNPSHEHGIAAQNMFRVSADGRIEQLGQAWLFHMFCALQQNVCGVCEGGGGCQSVLHPLCSDPHTSSRAGSQGGLGPKWQVNPHTVEFPLPWNGGEGTDGSFRRRIRVRNVELDPKLNPGARYFLEAQFIAPDDAARGNGNNGASYREVTVDPDTHLLTFVAPTQRERAGIHAWPDSDPAVSVVEIQVDADGKPDAQTGTFDDGLFFLAYRATDNGDGTWRYEYAIQNLNSHRAGRSFLVPIPDTVAITNVGFHDVDYHSGDGIGGVNFDGTDWRATIADGAIRWDTDSIETNENANALRWGTLYNFRFTADAPPAPVTGRLDLFRPGDPAFMPIALLGPNGCPGDLDADGVVDFADVLAVLAAWGPCPPPPDCTADLDAGGAVDFADLLRVLAAWGPCR